MIRRFALTIFYCLCSLSLFAQNAWERTGGPIGGLGYNVRIHPDDKNLMFVTDVFSGVNKSVDGGQNWVPANTGIDKRTGETEDAIPVFSLTIDPFDTNEIWVGTQGSGGVYKSVNTGDSYTSMTNGLEQVDHLTVRNFTIVKINDVKTVFLSGELDVQLQGDEFSRVKGVIYKTEDGGLNWMKIWEGNSLARWLEPIPSAVDPTRLVLATGIFDREAFNVAGEGILVSTDNGQTWNNSNTGLTNSQFVGGMDCSPASPNTIIIGTGNNNDSNKEIFGGIYKSTDGGATWSHKFGITLGDIFEDKITAVQFSDSDPNIVYAANEFSVYRSEDAGESWTRMSQSGTNWGAPGIRAGFPIEMVVDADDPDIVFINNYGGGVFKSSDGGASWVTLSKGYTGAQISHVGVSQQNHSKVISTGRSGPYLSEDGGAVWNGIAFGANVFPENYTLVFNPNNDDELLFSDEHNGVIAKSTDNGLTWTEVFNHPEVNNESPADRHGAKEIVYAPSDPSIVYAGYAYNGFFGGDLFGESSSTVPASGGSSYDGYVGDFENSYGILKSTQGGAADSWQSFNNGLGGKLNVSQIRVDSEDPNKVIISLRSGGVFRSTDGATNWTDITSNLPERNIRSLDISKQNSDVIYAGTRFYGVYKTTDAGTTWSQVLAPIKTVAVHSINSLFGAVAVNPTNADVVVVADWWTGVYFSTDGGNSWDALNTGLSTKLVRDLEFSADGKFLFAGTTGEGVFRMQFTSEPLVELSNNQLDLGTVNIAENGTASFNLSNYGNAALNFTSFDFSGTAISVLNPPSNINAGSDLDITVSFSPTDEIDYDQTLTVKTNAGDFVIQLEGTGQYLECTDALAINGANAVCGDETSILDAGTGFDSYQWFKDGVAISGANQQTYEANSSGSYSVRVINTGACAKTSDGFTFTINEFPGTTISVDGATLTAPSGASYQWSRDGIELSGETNQTIRAIEAGVYTVEVTSSAGCTAISDPVTATPIVDNGLPSEALALVYPNPSQGVFRVHFPNPNRISHSLNLVDAEGRSHWSKEGVNGNQVEVNKPMLPDGIYVMRITSKLSSYTIKILVKGK